MISASFALPLEYRDAVPFGRSEVRRTRAVLEDLFARRWSLHVEYSGDREVRTYSVDLQSWREVGPFLDLAIWMRRFCELEEVTVEIAGISETFRQ